MKWRVFLGLLTWALHLQVQAQAIGVPDSLKEGANEVALEDATLFEVFSPQKSRLTRKYKALILSKSASRYNVVSLYYDDFRKIGSANVRVLNGLGLEIETYKLRDFDDYGMDGGSLITDARLKYLAIQDHPLPFIVEVEYSVDYSGSLFYPAWQPQLEKDGVMTASFEVKSEIGDAFRHKSVGVKPEEVGPNHLRWEVRNLVPYTEERFSYGLDDYAPYVQTAPNTFQMDGVEGDLSTWDGLGQWIGKLNEGKDDLTPEQVADLVARVPDDATDMDKVRIAYQYLQESTRYVSIQLGLGGWRPFDASFVHEKKYGDCKALSNYTKSLLNVLGVKSYYTLINAGAFVPQLDPDFPMSSFNHAILTVPMAQDTIWLECTSQTNPFGYLGTFTSGRRALMITEKGAEVITTRSYKAEENRQITNTSIEIWPDGSGTLKTTRAYYGLEVGNDGFSRAVRKGPSEQEKWFIDEHDWGNLKLEELELTAPSQNVIPHGEMTVIANIQNVSRKSANRLFFSPFFVSNVNSLKLKSRERDVPVEIRYGFSQMDSVSVTFPAGYYPENDFAPVKISNDFGVYELNFHQGEEGYVFTRSMVLRAGKYSPEQYEAFREFIKRVHRGDRKRLVLINKT